MWILITLSISIIVLKVMVLLVCNKLIINYYVIFYLLLLICTLVIKLICIVYGTGMTRKDAKKNTAIAFLNKLRSNINEILTE